VEGPTKVTRTKNGLMKYNRALNKTKELKKANEDEEWGKTL
jgi:hypothetical protein